MKTLLLTFLCLIFASESVAQPLVPIAQDSVPYAEFARYHDSLSAPLKPMNVFSFGDAPAIWFIKPDTSDMTTQNTSAIRVWGYVDKNVEITVCSGYDKSNLWVLQQREENPHRTGYGAYDYVFSTQYNRPAEFVFVTRQVWKADGTKNGQGHASIDCVETLPVMNGVSVQSVAPSKAIKYFDLLGREVMPTHSGVYVTSTHQKILIVK